MLLRIFYPASAVAEQLGNRYLPPLVAINEYKFVLRRSKIAIGMLLVLDYPAPAGAEQFLKIAFFIAICHRWWRYMNTNLCSVGAK